MVAARALSQDNHKAHACVCVYAVYWLRGMAVMLAHVLVFEMLMTLVILLVFVLVLMLVLMLVLLLVQSMAVAALVGGWRRRWW